MKRIDHIAIAVADLDAAEVVYRDTLNLEWGGREEVATQKVLTSIFKVGESRLELVSPTAGDSPIAAFLRKKGGGLHHICFEVDDIEAEMKNLKDKGMRLLNSTPTPGVGGSRVVFLHPKDSSGVLVELVEKG
ncbi:methylmalonyl-CoA epimerase [candidate division LCP-89 bacterium B3_LCP]|uniref:Methylmalonyl-CoA epimerase n=1 Tax=candidate division LCP-89 bacterium B3_LCP TaxID=2012998 RepID=A0A532V1C2_UNCL8|nr:MAG: methylmalonyl-CoA epimerase [candidate division LCP-89 bacterium B3_LCP]